MTADDAYARVCRLLYREANLLDDGHVRRWLDEVLGPEIAYEMPVRVTRERGAEEFSEDAFHLRENRATLTTRVARLESEYAWAEDPKSRTRRFVTNVLVDPADEPDAWRVASNLLVYRGRYDSAAHQLLSCARRDVVGEVDGALRVLRRTVLLDHTTLPVSNLAIFL